jgi:NaMN:DMB phosphoribosyltransferase
MSADTPVCDRERVIFMNARRVCKREYQRGPNWVLASEVFGLGSTYSFALCRRVGVDPEAKVSARALLSAKGGET